MRQHPTTWMICTFLIVVAGVVAYFGDTVGKRWARKRVSLFGLRPRWTGTVFAVGTGIGIVVIALGVMVTFSANARAALFHIDALQRLQDELTGQNRQLRVNNQNLRGEARQLQGKIGILETDIAGKSAEIGKLAGRLETNQKRVQRQQRELQRQAAMLHTTQRQLAAKRAELTAKTQQLHTATADLDAVQRQAAALNKQLTLVRAQYDKAQQDYADAERKLNQEKSEVEKVKRLYDETSKKLDSARKELADINGQLQRSTDAVFKVTAQELQMERKVAELQQQQTQLTAEVEKLVTELSHRQEIIQNITTGEINFHANEVIATKVIRGSRPASAVRKDLDALLDDASRIAEDRGAAKAEGERAVVIATRSGVIGGRRVYFYESHILDAVADEISQSADDMLCELFAISNFVVGEQVRVDIRIYPNRLIFSKDELLVGEDLDGRSSQAKLFQQLVSLLRDQVRTKAKQAGMVPGAGEQLGEVSYDQIFDVMSNITKLGCPVRVNVRAAADTWTGGPLHVKFEVLPVSKT